MIKNNSVSDLRSLNTSPMLNVYPDSIGGRLANTVDLLKNSSLENVFQSIYILPSIFNTDLDRGFSIIDYELNKDLATFSDLSNLKKMDVEFKFDFVLNHASVLSHQFQDILSKGEDSKYKDFFIDWNKFWEGYGELTEEGHIKPNEEYIKDMFFRKPGLPIMNVRMPNGTEIPYWNTFYQEVKYSMMDEIELMKKMNLQYHQAKNIADRVNNAIKLGKTPTDINYGPYKAYKVEVNTMLEEKRTYLGQMDLNVKSPVVWEYYEDTIKKLAEYGAKIIRLDAFAYASKEPGFRNFFNEPGTWEILERLRLLAAKYKVTLLPEIHSTYAEKIHEKISQKGYLTYDFFLPGLIIDAFETKSKGTLVKWINDLVEKNIYTVNMLGCHDGIPLLDLKGLLTEERIEKLVDLVVKRGGLVKELHGKKNLYYQVNATYFSALGEDDKKMLLARAIQIFMPGKPQVWYLDLFAGKNNIDAVKALGSSGHKEINRTNLSDCEIAKGLENKLVQMQLSLLRFRNTFSAFGFDSNLTIAESEEHILKLSWKKDGYVASLVADLAEFSFSIQGVTNTGEISYDIDDLA